MPFNEDNYYKAFEDTEKFLKESIIENQNVENESKKRNDSKSREYQIEIPTI